MDVKIQKIETFGVGIDAYRIIPDNAGETRDTEVKPAHGHEIQITENANTLGEQLRAQLGSFEPR